MGRKATPLPTRLRIAELRERNWPYRAIAREVGLSISGVQYWCFVQGAEPAKPCAAQPRREASMVRNGRPVHPFTAEDDALILALHVQDFSDYAIAKLLTRRDPGRPRRTHSVTYRLRTLAREEERREAVHSAFERDCAAARTFGAPVADHG